MNFNDLSNEDVNMILEKIWKSKEKKIKEAFITQTLESCRKMDIELLKEDNKIKGFFIYKRDTSRLYIHEMVSDFKNRWVMFKGFRKISKGVKKMFGLVCKLDHRLISTYRNMGFKFNDYNAFNFIVEKEMI